ncbi:hypothetical protein GH865_07070 [Rhodocyclus tenuis]|uniref:O-antigen ligase-related domain-containing protein n=1 Tax=Rhodocyclus tenuis TaxID=1066 RepID=A0A6L5JUH5_RHOTE|nr:O-antigen ligase family protein [Rhodocyclus gracilis]MQY51033.1 hypothetical protein [Rhodocyclus gracilis]MRD73012.1 hypothetical protein [Rhodocyclus gracilis]
MTHALAAQKLGADAHHADLSGWFAVLAATIGGTTLGWYFNDPGLFFVQLPIFLIALGVGSIAWIGVLRNRSTWLPVSMIGFVFLVMDLTLRSGYVSGGSFDIQSVLKGVAWVFVLTYGLANGAKKLPQDALLLLFFAYTLYAFASAFYSKAMLLGVGSGCALLALSTFAGVIGSWDRATLTRMWGGIFLACVVMGMLSLTLYFVAPQMAIDIVAGPNRLRGATGSGNSLGPIMSIGILLGIYHWSDATKAKRFVLAITLVLLAAALLMSQSRASIFGLIAGILVVAALGNVLVSIVALLLGSVAIWSLYQPGVVDSLLSELAALISRTGRVTEITSFTGRSDIWAAVTHKWLESPWIGFGLGSPRIVIPEAYADRWGNTHESAHNWLLESLISFGIVGTTLLLLFLVALGWRLWRLKKPDASSASGGTPSTDWPMVLFMRRCFVFCLVSGLMEKAFAGMPSPSLIALSCLAGSCTALAHRKSRPVIADDSVPWRASTNTSVRRPGEAHG